MSDGNQPDLLYYGDNLDILRRYINDRSVDLLYADPSSKSNPDNFVTTRLNEKARAT